MPQHITHITKKDPVFAKWNEKGKKDTIHVKYGPVSDQLWINPDAAECIAAELERVLAEKPE